MWPFDSESAHLCQVVFGLFELQEELMEVPVVPAVGLPSACSGRGT